MKKVPPDFKRKVVVEPYGYSVTVVFTDDVNRVTREIIGDVAAAKYGQRAQARHIYDAETRLSVLVFYRNVTFGDIVHECFHVTHRIFEIIGHDISEHAHEPHAYLLEWIFEWVRKQARKAGLKPQ